MDFTALNQTQRVGPVANTETTPEPPTRHRDVVVAVRAANQAELLGQGRELAFRFDRDTRRQVIELRDRVTGEVLQQIPSESLLRVMDDLLKPAAGDSLELS